MAQYISILRGINVSGKNKIPMKDLKAMYEALGLKNVTTYIQSGNVVFTSSTKTPGTIAQKIQQEIKQHFGFDVPVVIRTPEEMQAVIARNPFAKEKGIDMERLYITFLDTLPAKEHLDKMAAYNFEPDRFIILDKEVYLHCPVSYGNSKLNNNFFENKLKVTATTRNWRTVNELVRICESLS